MTFAKSLLVAGAAGVATGTEDSLCLVCSSVAGSTLFATAVRSSDPSLELAPSSLVAVLVSLAVGIASVDGAWTTSVDGANSSVCSSAAAT